MTRKRVLNSIFLTFCIVLLLFLYLAPEETTMPLPTDDVHKKFHLIKSKKEADKLCAECHRDDGSEPLSATHPPPYRCLFCHKRKV